MKQYKTNLSNNGWKGIFVNKIIFEFTFDIFFP